MINPLYHLLHQHVLCSKYSLKNRVKELVLCHMIDEDLDTDALAKKLTEEFNLKTEDKVQEGIILAVEEIEKELNDI